MEDWRNGSWENMEGEKEEGIRTYLQKFISWTNMEDRLTSFVTNQGLTQGMVPLEWSPSCVELQQVTRRKWPKCGLISHYFFPSAPLAFRIPTA